MNIYTVEVLITEDENARKGYCIVTAKSTKSAYKEALQGILPKIKCLRNNGSVRIFDLNECVFEWCKFYKNGKLIGSLSMVEKCKTLKEDEGIIELAKFVKAYADERGISVLQAIKDMGMFGVRTTDLILSLTREDGGSIHGKSLY